MICNYLLNHHFSHLSHKNLIHRKNSSTFKANLIFDLSHLEFSTFYWRSPGVCLAEMAQLSLSIE